MDKGCDGVINLKHIKMTPYGTMKINSLISIAVLTFLMSGCIASRSMIDQLEVGSLSEKSLLVKSGQSIKDVKKIMGIPQVVIQNPDKRQTYLHYCIYGFTDDEDVGFWLYDDKVYAKQEKKLADYDYQDYNLKPKEQAEMMGGVSTKLGDWNCYDGVQVHWEYSPQFEDIKKYNIDTLRVTSRRVITQKCPQLLLIEGMISPDSSFTVSTLLKQISECKAEHNEVGQVTISMASSGGILKDGYTLGEALRKYKVKTTIENTKTCASSCAVAFLGGVSRDIEPNGIILFHSPYYTSDDASPEINCDIGAEVKDELNSYYNQMIGETNGNRIFERTMWYCDKSNGWTIKGNEGAALYGITIT